MATRSQARLFAQLIEKLQPEIQRAFMASVTDLQANVDWSLLLRELASGSVEGAISALNINVDAWNQYAASMTQAFASAGASTAAQIQQTGAGSVGIRFRMSNPRAQQWIERNVTGSVVGFTQEQIESARAVISAGYGRGQGPRTIATDLVGRATGGGAREGGILGLDGPRSARLQAVTQGMRTAEGVQDLVIKHVNGTKSVRYKVNKATADRIIKAYDAGVAVPEKDRIISERQYKNALLKDRADTVAETEAANAVMAARDEQWQQLAESQGLETSDIIKTWQHRRGSTKYHRPDHLAMSGVSVRGLHTPFLFPDGTRMQYAHDPAGGAKHTIRCACDTEYRLQRRVS